MMKLLPSGEVATKGPLVTDEEAQRLSKDLDRRYGEIIEDYRRIQFSGR